MIIVHDPSCISYISPGHPESPSRIIGTQEKLTRQSDFPIQWEEPLSVQDEHLLRAHSPEHLQQIRTQTLDFDPDTPCYPQIAHHARQAVGASLKCLEFALQGQKAFSLMRPPGHHAERSRAMGFCYFNQIAISALEALNRDVRKVAVYDFDVHHGNGTENILRHHPQCSFFSIHQYPCYPGTGKSSSGNCFNYPVPPDTDRKTHRNVLEKALLELKRFKPDLVAVSAGFDAYAGDPLSEENLEAEDFYWLGASLHQLGLPIFSVLEGGYSRELPDLIAAFLKGFEGL